MTQLYGPTTCHRNERTRGIIRVHRSLGGDRAQEQASLKAAHNGTVKTRGGKGASCTTQESSGSSLERKREGNHIQWRATHRRHVTSLGFDEEIDYICSKYNGRENGASRGGTHTTIDNTGLSSRDFKGV